MNYYQKYLKYKAKYIALQEGGGVEKLRGIAIPPELQALDNAYLPGFNIDEAYVEPLLAASKYFTKPDEIINFLRQLNAVSENGLCASGNRNNNKKVSKADIDSLLSKATVNDDHKDALKFFKNVEEIRNADVQNMNTPELMEFQKFDDIFLPGFNVDKAYVGHLLYYVLKNKNSKNSTDVLKNLSKLNKTLTSVLKKKTGLNEKGDRMIQGKSFKGKEIQKNLDEMIKKNITFPDTTQFEDLAIIANKNNLFRSI